MHVCTYICIEYVTMIIKEEEVSNFKESEGDIEKSWRRRMENL